MVLQNHPNINFVHRVDHWWPNRSDKGPRSKWKQYRLSRRKAILEIQQVDYDIALCIYPYFIPDLMDVAWRAGIPIRIGFSRSVYASLATHLVDVPDGAFIHQSLIQAQVLTPLNIDPKHLAKLRPLLAAPSPNGLAELLSCIGAQNETELRFSIIHMGSGQPSREMPPSFWREVARRISADQKVLFTGRGSREEAKINEAIAGLANCVNVCNRLSWDGLVAAVSNARELYGVESMAGHLAACLGTPCIVAYTGTSGVARWRPLGENVNVITRHLPCAPCNKSKGCEEMPCFRLITPEELVGTRNGIKDNLSTQTSSFLD